jgi:hypothetical protein
MRYIEATPQRLLVSIAIVSLLLLVARPLVFKANAATLNNRRLQIASAIADDQTTYNFTFKLTTAGTVGSIRFLFCSDSPLIGDPCTAPTGFDASAAVLSNQFGVAGFGLTASTNELLLTRAPQAAGAISVGYRFDDVMNPSSAGSYYARILTYASGNGTGPATDSGGLAFSLSDQLAVSTTVPPYLLFCMGIVISGFDCGTASGDYINFGELSKSQARVSTMQMLLATNGIGGYSVTVNGTTMLSGVNSIPAVTGSDVSRPGTSQFGINLRNNSDPDIGADPVGSGSGSVSAGYNTANRYHFVSGEQVVSAPTADAYRKYTVSYVVNVANGQEPGVYVSTLTYIANATF